MDRYFGVAIITLLCGIMAIGMALTVAKIHQKTGIMPPAMTGDPLLERAVRAHYNTLEWLPVFLPAMWLFAIYWNPLWAAALGLLWLAGRIVYFAGYLSAAPRRMPGFFIQAMTTFVLVLGALGRIVYLWIVLPS